MIDYRLHVFRQVAEVRSLTKASKALHLSQPAVSKHIKLLEEELRVPLFVRSSTGVVLTDAGTIFLKHVQETEKSRAAVMEKLQAPVGLLTGTLRLGSSMTIASYYLLDVLVGFRAKYAAVKCEEILYAAADAERIGDYILTIEQKKEIKHTQEVGVMRKDIPHAERTYLAVPYVEREEAKELGARWDAVKKSWYVGSEADRAKIAKWDPKHQAAPTQDPRAEFAAVLREIGAVVKGDHPIM